MTLCTRQCTHCVGGFTYKRPALTATLGDEPRKSSFGSRALHEHTAGAVHDELDFPWSSRQPSEAADTHRARCAARQDLAREAEQPSARQPVCLGRAWLPAASGAQSGLRYLQFINPRRGDGVDPFVAKGPHVRLVLVYRRLPGLLCIQRGWPGNPCLVHATGAKGVG